MSRLSPLVNSFGDHKIPTGYSVSLCVGVVFDKSLGIWACFFPSFQDTFPNEGRKYVTYILLLILFITASYRLKQRFLFTFQTSPLLEEPRSEASFRLCNILNWGAGILSLDRRILTFCFRSGTDRLFKLRHYIDSGSVKEKLIFKCCKGFKLDDCKHT